MKLNDLPEAKDAVRAAMKAILRGRFMAPEVLEVLEGRTGSLKDYWSVRLERSRLMDIEYRANDALLEIRVLAGKARKAIDEILERGTA